MSRRVVIIQGHPDPAGGHFCHALADAYRSGAEGGGHHIEQIDVATLGFPWLQNAEDFEKGSPPAAIERAQGAIETADHLLFIYPLWLGDMPAILKAFLEQTLRPRFVSEGDSGLGPLGTRRLKGKSARIVVTMGMPGIVYRWFYRAHSLKSFKRSILKLCGIRPVTTTVIGMNGGNTAQRDASLVRIKKLGRQAA